MDVNYNDLVSDPLKTVGRLYRELGLPLTPATMNACRLWRETVRVTAGRGQARTG